MKSKLILYKQIGETPLECLNRFKSENLAYKELPMTYAGRLDPMAEGLLLILVGEECKKKADYLYLSKEYEIEVLFGFKTDTGDLLGKVVGDLVSPKKGRLSLQEGEIQRVLEKVKNVPQKYPAYSSKTFEGKPLWQWAREGEEKEVESNAKITEIEFLGQREIQAEELLNNIESRINKVTGDFRQKEILSLWKESLVGKDLEFSILKFRILCSGGAYMRVLAEEIGKLLGVSSLAYSIKRTKIGEYKI